MAAWFLALALIAGVAIGCSRGSSASHDTSTPTIAVTSTPAGSAGCSAVAAHPPGNFNDTIDSGGLTRKYILHIPPSYDASTAMPLLLAFHGYAMPADFFATYVRFGELADAKGFIVVTPWGTGDPLYWNASVGGASAPDDVTFVKDLLARLDVSLCIDPARTYAAGYSLGGAMAELLACQLPDRIAAVGLVAAVSISCGAKAPVIAFHGTSDPEVLFEGSGPGTPGGSSAPVRRVISEWARNLGCDGLPTISRVAGDIELSTFHNCTAGDGEALLYTIIGGGHTWPGATLDLPIGPTSKSVDASSLVWDFFAAHPKVQ